MLLLLLLLLLIPSSSVDSEDKERVIQYLLKKHAKLNLQDVQGRTALMFACSSNSSRFIIEALVKAKANPWVEDESGCTSFDHAINTGNLETTRLLINSCREDFKMGNAVEMSQLQECLSKIQEMRKVSWPLMGLSGRSTPANLYAPINAPPATDSNQLSAESAGASPKQERRRKRSICHFDPLDIDEIMKKDEATDPKPITLAKVANTPTACQRTRPPSLRQMTDDESISLHFSSNEGSFDEPCLGPEMLLKLKEPSTDSNDTPSTKVPFIRLAADEGRDDENIERNLNCDEFPTISIQLPHQNNVTKDASLRRADANTFSEGQEGKRLQHTAVDVRTNETKEHKSLDMDPSGRGRVFSCVPVSPNPSPRTRRRTLPASISRTAASPRISLSPSCEEEKNETVFRRYTISSTDVSKLCSSFVLQRLSPPPKDFCAEAEHRKLVTPGDTHPSDDTHNKQTVEAPLIGSLRRGERSPVNDRNSTLEMEHMPTAQKEPTVKCVQLPVISLQKKGPLLPLASRGPVTSCEEMKDMPQYTEMLHREENCVSPHNKGRNSPFRGRSPELSSKSVHRLSREALPARQHPTSPTSGKAEHDSRHGFTATEGQLPYCPVSPNRERATKQPRTFLPPLRIANAPANSFDSEEGYYSCSPSPFDSESPKRTPGLNEQPRYLFKPISPRSPKRSDVWRLAEDKNGSRQVDRNVRVSSLDD